MCPLDEDVLVKYSQPPLGQSDLKKIYLNILAVLAFIHSNDKQKQTDKESIFIKI